MAVGNRIGTLQRPEGHEYGVSSISAVAFPRDPPHRACSPRRVPIVTFLIVASKSSPDEARWLCVKDAAAIINVETRLAQVRPSPEEEA